MKICFILLATTLVSFSGAMAADFSTQFGSPYNHDAEVAGQDGWTIDDPTPDLSFFVSLNGSQAAALGGFYDTPSNPGVKLSHPVGIPLVQSYFRYVMAILPSTENYPGRDTFGWVLSDPDGANLFTLRFVPLVSNPSLLNIVWSTGAGPFLVTGRAVATSAPYTFDAKFTSAGGANVGFIATVTGATTFSFSGALPGQAGKTWGSVGAIFVSGAGNYGDNFMIFDNLTAATLPPVDADGDGYSAETEAWFGTSDSNRLSFPTSSLSFVLGTASLSFPSVPGNTYLIESSDDLSAWAPTPVTALTPTTVWQDPALASGKRFYRVRKP